MEAEAIARKAFQDAGLETVWLTAASSLADVFFGNIEEVATARTDETILLGHVMAHEVGTARDIPRMQAGRVQFSRRQADRLRAAVALRLGKIQQR